MPTLRIPPTLRALAILAPALHAPALAQEVVYEHELVRDASRVGLGWFSSSEERPNKNFRRVDDFTLDADASIGSVVWWGQSSGDFANDLSNFTSFTVEFYSARTTAGGELRPTRNPFASETFAIGDVAMEATGRVASHGGLEHRFGVDLGSAVDLSGGEVYFFSISAAHVDPSLDAFQWSDAEEVNGYGGSWSYTDEQWQMFQDTDSAFQLISVPAPGAMGVLGVGVAVLGRRTR
ncbi:MAG: hypothetical protein ACF8Q5_13260 [Phycisphaerales bacterium JB040]